MLVGRAAAGEHDRAFGRRDDADGIVEIVTGRLYARRRKRNEERIAFVLDQLMLQVGRNVQRYRTALDFGPADRAGKIVERGRRRTQLLEASAGRQNLVTLRDVLEVLAIDRGRVAAKEHDRRERFHALHKRRERVGHGRAVRHRCNADLAGHGRVAERHQCGAAFMRGADKAAALLAHETVDEVEIGVADQSESWPVA
jgi:hypothetical protein